VAGQWFSLGPLLSSTDKTDHHDIAEILLNVALNTIKPTNQLERLKTFFFSEAFKLMENKQ
jgi:hypothetical protein